MKRGNLSACPSLTPSIRRAIPSANLDMISSNPFFTPLLQTCFYVLIIAKVSKAIPTITPAPTGREAKRDVNSVCGFYTGINSERKRIALFCTLYQVTS